MDGGGYSMKVGPPGLKPGLIFGLRGAEAPLFHETGWADETGRIHKTGWVDDSGQER
jgi:hypothetical protein